MARIVAEKTNGRMDAPALRGESRTRHRRRRRHRTGHRIALRRRGCSRVRGRPQRLGRGDRGHARRHHPVFADIGEEDQIDAAFAACRAQIGTPTLVCNNVGISIVEGRLHETRLETFDKVWAINIRGAMQVLQLAIRGMLDAGSGAIVNMASIGSFRASPTSSAYIVSKGAMLMMTRQAALEYAQDNIRVNSVHPGLIGTEMIKQRDPALLKSKVDATPMGRMGTPEEIAALTAFLCSAEASYVTGAAYMADGGRSAG
jgi:NAD(P)-dependent dehydrogenase (short-subunit alcohol dehydrogenase family)